MWHAVPEGVDEGNGADGWSADGPTADDARRREVERLEAEVERLERQVEMRECELANMVARYEDILEWRSREYREEIRALTAQRDAARRRSGSHVGRLATSAARLVGRR